jgi:hypothetical protein
MNTFLHLITFASAAAAKCACGYTVNSTGDANHALFTDLLETDFLHLQDITYNETYSTGWIPQNYNTTALEDQGSYGMAKEDRNVVPNFIKKQYNWAGSGVKGAEPGLQLWVRNQPIGSGENRFIESAELVSERDDILYGSFRIAMKTTAVNGTCSAFFVYKNDSQEIDLEILSSEQTSTSRPVHFVVQNTTTPAGANGALVRHSEQDIYSLPSPGPSEGYNEYRFDWLPSSITYYINGNMAWSTNWNVPDSAGRVHLSHWSNGNPLWSGGPPAQDAVMTVSYVKAYFNSTNTTRNSEYGKICPAEGSGELMCEIPSQMEPPNPYGGDGNKTGRTFFFTLQANSTPGQVVYNSTTPQEGRAASLRCSVVSWLLCTLVVSLGLIV